MKKRFLGKYDGKKYGWFMQAKELIFMLILVFLLFQFVLGISRVSGSSMTPTLEDGTLVLYARIIRNYDYGDIVAVDMPSGEHYVKRVVALGGDTVDIRDGRLYVNGKVETAAYASGATEAQGGEVSYPYTVEENRVFVLGDNRADSIDSRIFGSLAKRQIKGKLIFSAG